MKRIVLVNKIYLRSYFTSNKIIHSQTLIRLLTVVILLLSGCNANINESGAPEIEESISGSNINKQEDPTKIQTFSESDILNELDLSYKELPGKYIPTSHTDVTYNIFPDLEHGYCVIASSRIHLYSDS